MDAIPLLPGGISARLMVVSSHGLLDGRRGDNNAR